MLKIIYTPLHKIHKPFFEVYEGETFSYPEVPERIEIIAKILRENGYTDFISPSHFPQTYLEKVHHKDYIVALQERSKNLLPFTQSFGSYYVRDTYAPLTDGTYDAALHAVDVALHGAKLIKDGENLIYSLCRPPGHHAEHNTMGGYCYFNNAAIAAEYLSEFGKVAILDIDFHHGNGTQDIFYARNDVLYVSLHADPSKKYPFVSGFADEVGIEKGRGFNKNYPLPWPNTTEKKYRETLLEAIKDVENYQPKFLIVSVGFDTYIKDPIGKLGLDIPSYEKIGRDIAALNLPTLLIQEGGYKVSDLGEMALSLVHGFTT